MLNNLKARLDPVYRSVATCLDDIASLEDCLGRYCDEVRNGGRFDPETRARIWCGVLAAVALLNRMLAIYRDVEMFDEGLRIEVSRETGELAIAHHCGAVGLLDELRLFLHVEEQRAGLMFAK